MRTLVAMEIYSSHRLIMGKVEICIFLVSMEIFGFFFTEMFIEQSSMFHMTLSKSVYLIGFRGGKKGQFL